MALNILDPEVVSWPSGPHVCISALSTCVLLFSLPGFIHFN